MQKLIIIDLKKQQALDADPKSIQQITFTGKLERGNTKMFFTTENVKENISDFSTGTMKVL